MIDAQELRSECRNLQDVDTFEATKNARRNGCKSGKSCLETFFNTLIRTLQSYMLMLLERAFDEGK